MEKTQQLIYASPTYIKANKNRKMKPNEHLMAPIKTNKPYEYILCAAVKRLTPRQVESNPYNNGNDILNIELGYRHHDIYARFDGELEKSSQSQGFYTSYGRFVDRYEAMEIAYKAGQVSKTTAFQKASSIDIHFENDATNIEPKTLNKYSMLFSEDLY